MFKIMQQRNPELFAAMLEKENEDQRMLDAVAQEEGVEQEQNMAMEQQLSNSFMGTPQDVIMDAELEEEEEEPVPEEQIIQEERVV